MRRTLEKKSLIILCLLGIVGLDLALLLPYYMKSEAPIGWDAAAYIQVARDIKELSFPDFFKKHFYTHFYSFFEFAINELLVHDLFLAEKVLPIAMNLAVVLFLTYVVQRVFRDYRLSILTALFTVPSTTLIRLTSDLRRNSMGSIFLLSTLLLMYETRRKPSSKHYMMLLISWILLIITHVESGFFLMLAVLAYEVLFSRTWKLGVKKLFVAYWWMFIPPALFFILFFPYSIEFLRFFFVECLYRQGWEMLPFALDDIVFTFGVLGGVNIPFVVFGLSRWVKQTKNRGVYQFLVSWSITALVFAGVFWGLGDRSLLFFPSSFLSAVGFLAVYQKLTKSEMSNNLGEHCSPCNMVRRRKVVIGIGLILLVSLNVYTAEISAVRWLHPFIENETYQNLRWLATTVQEPVIVLFRREVSWAYASLQLHRDWVGATFGTGHVYFGKLHTLLHAHRTVFNHDEVEKFSEEAWNDLLRHNITENLGGPNGHPVILLDEFYVSPLTPYEKTLLSEERPGVYMLRSNYTEFTMDLYSLRVVPYTDYYDGSYNWYSNETDWAATGYVLRTFEENPIEEFYINYRILLLSNITYLAKLRLHDASSDFAPVTVLFDDQPILEITYNGTGSIAEAYKLLEGVTEGFHMLTLRISDLTRPHMLALDYIDFIPV